MSAMAAAQLAPEPARRGAVLDPVGSGAGDRIFTAVTPPDAADMAG